MNSRTGCFGVALLVVLLIMHALETLADVHFPGFWWTHQQVYDYGGLVLLGVFFLIFLLRRD